jgi:phage shock protein PspC (stress-responsive transcriptional regulator)/FtsH-binding integral membrane protein
MTDPEDSPARDSPARSGLVRSRKGKVIAGVCEGAGRYFDIDPVVFRVVLGVLALTGGLGLVAYGVVWLLVPMEGEEESEAHRLLSGRVEGTALTAVLVTLVGCGLFLSMLGSAGNQAFSLVLLAALAGAVYWSQTKRRTPETAETAPPAPQPPPAPATAPWWREPIAKDAPYEWGPDDAPYAYDRRGLRDWRERHRAARHDAHREARRDARPPFGGMLFLLAVAVAAAAIGIAVSWHARPLGTSLEIGFGAALAVLGLGFVVSSRWGRLGGGTVFVAVLVTALLVGSAALPKSIGTQWAHRTWAPAAVADVRPAYKLGSGEAVLDLSALRPGGKDHVVSTRAEVGAGQLKVTVPENVTLRLKIQVGLGDIQLPGEKRTKDVDVQPGVERDVTIQPADGLKSAGTLKLDLQVGVGQVTVSR